MFGYLDMYRGDRRPVYDDWRDNVLKRKAFRGSESVQEEKETAESFRAVEED